MGSDDRKEGDRRERRQQQRETEPPAPLHPDASDPTAAEPHHSLSNPASTPDPTEYPDPYERRPDPRGPDGEEQPAGQDEDGPGGQAPPDTPRSPSTSEPHPPRNYDDLKPVKGDR
jgi:hypothetical protein